MTTPCSPSPPPAAREPPPLWRQLRRIADTRWIVLAILFLVTGALGLPLLWISRAFSRPAKVLWSVAVTLYTAALIWICWVILVWSWTRIHDAWRAW